MTRIYHIKEEGIIVCIGYLLIRKEYIGTLRLASEIGFRGRV